MLENFLFSLNTVMPLFFLIAIGFFLNKARFFPDGFLQAANKMVFYIMLPAALFNSVYSADLDEVFDFEFVAFAVGATVASFVVIWAVAAIFIKDKSVLGAFVQGAFRSNSVFIGIPLIRNLAGEAGVARFAVILAFIMPLYNICSILVLSANQSEKLKAKTIAFTIIKNPLIIAISIALVFSLLNIPVPQMLARPIADLSNTATTMALICLGGGITFLGFDKKLKYVMIASVLKVVVLPIAFTAAAFALGFTGIDLAAFMILGGTSSAFASYVMAVQLGGDGYTAANIILISTLLSSVTLTVFVYVLMSLGWL